jgi:hypothetical protein
MKMTEGTPAKATAIQYTCPMHPEVVQDAPGNCPKCGMTLVSKKTSASAGQDAMRGHEGMKGMTGTAPAEGSGNMNMVLGVWLVASPFTLGYLSKFIPNASALRVVAERGLSSFETRNLWMTYSDTAPVCS